MNGRDRAPAGPAVRCLLAVAVAVQLGGAPLVYPESAAPESADSGKAASEIKPFSAAERRAVELAALYLEGGAEALAGEFAEGSSWSALSEAGRRLEIETRLGPVAAAHWTLLTPSGAIGEHLAGFEVAFPSGAEDVVEFALLEERGVWKLDRIVSSVEARPEPISFEELFAGAAAEDSDAMWPAPSADRGPPWWLALLILACALWTAGNGRRALRPAVGLLSGALLALIAPACKEAPEEVDAAPELELLAAARDARWTTAGAAVATIAKPPPASAAERADRIWQAERALARSDFETVEQLLSLFPEPSVVPKVEELRGELALLERDADSAIAAFERRRDLGLAYDSVTYDLAIAKAGLGQPEAATATIQLMAEVGSRFAWPHYAVAKLALADEDEEGALAAFERAWQLGPMSWQETFQDPTLTAIVGRPELFDTLRLDRSSEPVVLAPEAGASAVPLPESGDYRTYGSYLVARLGGAALHVPNGAELGPDDALPQPAGSLETQVQEEALERVTAGLEEGRPFSEMEHLVELAASGLYRDGKWDEVVDLTGRLDVGLERGSPILVWLRAFSMAKIGDDEAARAMLLEVAQRDVGTGHLSPIHLSQLAELLAERDAYDQAVRVLAKANAMYPSPTLETRIRQLRLEGRLQSSYRTLRTKHFELRYPEGTDPSHSEALGKVLEAERVRIRRWVPAEAAGRVGVDLFPLGSFLSTFGEGGVIGLFDGRVRVPLADLYSLHPSLVAILSHELAHALIDRRSAGRAPKWFHEGVAMHVQMVDQPTNPLPELAGKNRIFSLKALEAVLAGMSDPSFNQAAYTQAAWLAHFIEARFGRRTLDELMLAFSRGLDTEGAIGAVTGLEVAQFEQQFRDWGVTRAPLTWDTEVRRYDREQERERRLEAFERDKLIQPSTRSRRQPERERRRVTVDEDLRRRMHAWHAGYAETVRDVKLRLKPVLEMLDGRRNSGNLGTSCRALETSLRHAMSRDHFTSSPDPQVNSALRTSFSTFLKASQACQRGALQSTRQRIAEADRSLAKAAARLGIYGLAP